MIPLLLASSRNHPKSRIRIDWRLDSLLEPTRRFSTMRRDRWPASKSGLLVPLLLTGLRSCRYPAINGSANGGDVGRNLDEIVLKRGIGLRKLSLMQFRLEFREFQTMSRADHDDTR